VARPPASFEGRNEFAPCLHRVHAQDAKQPARSGGGVSRVELVAKGAERATALGACAHDLSGLRQRCDFARST
jgi:hypothetical protein